MRNLDLLIPQPTIPNDWWTWGTITSTAPLRVRLDGDDAPLDATPENLAGTLYVGTRVWVQMNGRRAIITAANANQPNENRLTALEDDQALLWEESADHQTAITALQTGVAGKALATATTLTNQVVVPIVFSSITNLKGGMTGGSTGLTLPMAGTYLISLQIGANISGAGFGHLALRANGATARVVDRAPFSPNAPTIFNGTVVAPFNAGTTVGMEFFHTNGADRTLYGSSYETCIEATLVAA